MHNIWRESGYEAFADGTFGNGGQNLYVSCAGVLQRIFRFDINRDGYTDIVFVNSQDMNERVPAYICSNVFGEIKINEVPSNGAYAGAVGDLNGDGYDDLVIAHQHNGVHVDITAYIYYGSAEGLSERYKIELPAPNCRAVAIGDFNGDGKQDIAFSSQGKLRIFYQQETGFLPGKFVDYDIDITHMTAADIDGDGCADLYVRIRKGRPQILWGGKDGINLNSYTLVGGDDKLADELPSSTPGRLVFVKGWTPKILKIKGETCLFRMEMEKAYFYPIFENRALGAALCLNCGNAVSAANGDIDGDGFEDIVIAVCDNPNVIETSWIYWGDLQGYEDSRRSPLPTVSVRDVAVGDLDGIGTCDIVLCQGATDILNTTESLIYRGNRNRLISEPVRIVTHDATCVFIARTLDCSKPQVIFVNREGGRVRGDVPIYVYYGGEDGFKAERRAELPGFSAPDAICCDFNDNGWADIFVCNCCENALYLDPGSYLYWGGADGFNSENKLVIPSSKTWGAAVGDFRHSGYLDLAVAGLSNQEILIFKGGPLGFDTDHPQRIFMETKDAKGPGDKELTYKEDEVRELQESRFIYTADFNSDGWLDIVITQIYGKYCFILWGGPEGFSIERSTWLAVEGSAYVQAADLNGDGWLELLVGSYQSMSKACKTETYVYIYWGGPEGFREDRRMQLPAHAADSITIADFNKDGVLDIFVGSYHGGRTRDIDSFIYWGKPGGVYEASNHKRLSTHSASGCMAADFNEDGWVDIAVANHKAHGNHTAKSQVWWNGPEGFSESNISWLPTLGPHGMANVDPGNVMDRSPEEYYISSSFELPEGANIVAIFWEAEIQPKTWVKAQVRFAAEEKELANAVWIGPQGNDEWFENGEEATNLNQTGRWVQYRLALGALNGGNSPRVTEVRVVYS